jgi:dGTPase
MYDFTRDHPDPLAADLPPLLIDRQRIVHSAAFRRLQHKTQVFVAPESDHFRTRLTHTLEVAHQARCITGVLGLDTELAEVVALAHDLGHPPFGHAGEAALRACLRSHGGFEHNRHALRIVEELEHPYPEFRGLNLTRSVRVCLALHQTPYDKPEAHPLAGEPIPPESAVVDLADRLTYALHDLQDGLYAGLIEPGKLAGLELWRAAYQGPPDADGWRGHLRPAVDRIQRRVLDDLAQRREVRGTPSTGAGPALSPVLEAQLNGLEAFLYEHVYRSPALRAADEQARAILTSVFDACVAHPEALPERFARRIDLQGCERVVADYVAGMTDRFCIQEHARLADLPV